MVGRWFARGLGDFAVGLALTLVVIALWWGGAITVWALLYREDFTPLVVVGELGYILVSGPAFRWLERRVL